MRISYVIRFGCIILATSAQSSDIPSSDTPKSITEQNTIKIRDILYRDHLAVQEFTRVLNQGFLESSAILTKRIETLKSSQTHLTPKKRYKFISQSSEFQNFITHLKNLHYSLYVLLYHCGHARRVQRLEMARLNYLKFTNALETQSKKYIYVDNYFIMSALEQAKSETYGAQLEILFLIELVMKGQIQIPEFIYRIGNLESI